MEFIAWFHFCRRLKRTTFVFFAKWKKNEFHAAIKHLHIQRFNAKRNQNWIMFMAYLHQRLRLYTIEWMNLNMVVYPHMMHLIWDPIKAATLKIIDKVHDIVLTEDARTYWGHRHITWHSDFNFARIGYDKAIGKMNAAFAYCGP